MKKFRIVLICMLAAVAVIVPVGSADARLGVGNQWFVYQGEALWSGFTDAAWSNYANPAGTALTGAFWPYGGPDTVDPAKFYEYFLIGSVKVTSGMCSGGRTRAQMDAEGFQGQYRFSFDLNDEQYGGTLVGESYWWCENFDGTYGGRSPQKRTFSLTFPLYTTGTRYTSLDCPWSTPTLASCTFKRLAQGGRAFFCWDYTTSGCPSDRKTIIEYYNLENLSRSWRGIGSGSTTTADTGNAAT